MPLWGKTDELASAPKYLNTDEIAETYFVDLTEASVASNIAKGINTPGWSTYKTYVDSNGATRHKFESLVPMKVSAVDAGDLGVTGDTLVEDAVVADV